VFCVYVDTIHEQRSVCGVCVERGRVMACVWLCESATERERERDMQ